MSGITKHKMIKYIKKHVWRMNMKKADSNEIINFLNTKWSGVSCPLCGGREWSVTDKFFELREFQDGNIIIGGNSAITPVIPVTCKNCGNTVLINAITTGLLKE